MGNLVTISIAVYKHEQHIMLVPESVIYHEVQDLPPYKNVSARSVGLGQYNYVYLPRKMKGASNG